MTANPEGFGVEEEAAAALKMQAERDMGAEQRSTGCATTLLGNAAHTKRNTFTEVLANIPNVGDDADYERGRN